MAGPSEIGSGPARHYDTAGRSEVMGVYAWRTG